MNSETILSVWEASTMLNVGPETIRRYVRTGDIICLCRESKHGEPIKIPKSELRKFCKNTKRYHYVLEYLEDEPLAPTTKNQKDISVLWLTKKLNDLSENLEKTQQTINAILAILSNEMN